MFRDSLKHLPVIVCLAIAIVVVPGIAFCQTEIEPTETAPKPKVEKKEDSTAEPGKSFQDNKPTVRKGIHVVAVFSALDTDEDGLLTIVELEKRGGDEEQLKAIPEQFGRVDSDQDGRLTEEEFRALPSGAKNERAEFVLLDKDNDQKLSLTEFQASTNGEQKRQLKRAFHFYDSDHDHTLNIDEYLKRGAGLEVDPLTAFLRRDEDLDGLLTVEEFQYDANGSVAIERAKQQFASVDENSDDRLTFEEFVNTPAGRPDSVSRFAFRDGDGDGLIDLAEFTSGISLKRQGRIQEVIHLGYDLDRDGRLSLEEFRETPEMKPIGSLAEIRDTNADGRLSLLEFQADRQGLQAQRAKVHFARFDANSDGVLDTSEFPVPLNPEADARPGCTDPELAFRRLDRNADDTLTLDEFKQRELGEDDSSGKRLEVWQNTADGMFMKLDADKDDLLSLEEFIPETPDREWVVADGENLRPKQGEMFNRSRFLASDKDEDGRLTLEEYQAKAPLKARDSASEQFPSFDQNGNGFLSFEEFKYVPGAVFKPRLRFQQIDKNENGSIEREEFLAQPGRASLNESTFVAFDTNSDAVWTFEEFALTPQANPIGRSLIAVSDENNDGTVSLDEFLRNEEPTARRLSVAQFDKYDRDQSGALTGDEFFFPVTWNSFPTPSLFDHFDQNDDDRIAFGELFPNPGNRLTQQKQQFASLDRNSDGFVDWKELQLNDPGTRQLNGPRTKRPVAADGTGGAPMGWIRPEDRPSIPDARTVFKSRDADSDQKLSLQEFSGASKPGGMKAAFEYFDRNNDQMLTFEEFQSTPAANPEADILFAGLERDGVTGLSIDEFINFRTGQLIERLQKIFERFDVDGNGSHSKEEFRATPDAHPTSDIILSSYDANADGKLDLEEFAPIYGKPSPRESKQFEALDLNRDGFLTLAELKLNDPVPRRREKTAAATGGNEQDSNWTEMVIMGAAVAFGLILLAFMLGRRAATR